MSGAAPLRIGLVLDRFAPERGGAERYLWELLGDLAGRGHDCRVYCRRGADAPAGVTCVRIPLRARTRAGQEEEFSRRSVEAAHRDGALVYGVRHVREADLYQPHGGTWAMTTEARRALHPWPSLHRWWRAVHPRYRFLARADEEVFRQRPGLLTVAVSELVREDILRRYGQYQPEVSVVWPWVEADTGMESRSSPPGAAPRLGFLAHNFRLKGLDLALAALRAPGLEGALLQVGGRGAVDPWRRRARRLGVAERVRFVGEVRRANEFWDTVDLLVHPTRHDPCALVCLEAMARGVPVVTTSCNGAAPLVRQAGGRVVSTPAASAIAEAVRALWDAAPDPELALAVAAGLTRAGHVTRMEELFQQARARRPG